MRLGLRDADGKSQVPGRKHWDQVPSVSPVTFPAGPAIDTSNLPPRAHDPNANPDGSPRGGEV